MLRKCIPVLLSRNPVLSPHIEGSFVTVQMRTSMGTARLMVRTCLSTAELLNSDGALLRLHICSPLRSSSLPHKIDIADQQCTAPNAQAVMVALQRSIPPHAAVLNGG